jgi:DNA-binding NtrC family response regulator
MTLMPNQISTILVVDDDQELADTLTEYLNQLGYQATAAYGGPDALRAFVPGKFNLVITDLRMPEVDGLQVLEKVKQEDPNAVVLVITGYGTVESAVEAMKLGAYDFVPKPIKLDELRLIVDRALERHLLASQLAFFRTLVLALIISVPVWLILGALVAMLWK